MTKISIKREQSQAGLSFAEREKFRPQVKNKLLLLLALLLTAATGAWAQEPATTYSVKMKDGTQDAKNWSIASGEKSAKGDAADGLTGLSEGQTVTLTYTGRLKVKGVKATSDAAPAAGKIVDLSTLTADYEAQDGDVLTNATTTYKVTIAAGATVTLDGVNISSGDYYCIKCAGDATIILKDGSTNTLASSSDSYPALWAGDANTTLTIQGSTGVLNVTSGVYCAGIGGGYSNTNNICGNIRIEGGVITAQGGGGGAGIGTDAGPATCGDIIITGGTITAKGGSNAAGIGTGDVNGSKVVCGDITIANTVTKVTATKGDNAPHSIGKGNGSNATCGTVTIGGVVYPDGISTSPYTYDPSAPAPAVVDLSMLDCAGNERTDGQWTANCYMVHTAGDYKLPLVYGNAIKNGATNSAAYTGVSGQLETFLRHDGSAITAPWIKDNGITVATAELLWQDAEGLITNVGIDGDYLTLTVGKDADAQEGNAVVAAKDGSGNIVWSWHIWVTKQTFASTDLTTIATGSHDYQVTPVNLGWVGDAVSRGYNTFYQWGRKDPFIPTTGTANTNHTVYNISNATVTGRTYSTSSATIADNIKNPTTFYSISDKPNTSTAYNLWDAQQTSTGNIATATVKTVYDPCPAGFCVPTGNLYYYIGGLSEQATTWDGTNKGQNLTSVSPNVFFPSSGCHQQTGGIYGVGNYGYYWSASPNSSSRGQNLDTQSGAQGLLWQNYLRANGFTVRPVADDEEPAPAAPALNITSPVVGQVIGSDGKNYAYGSLPTGVTAVAMIAKVSGTSGLAIALADEEGTMNWDTAVTTAAAHTPTFTGGTWRLPTQDEWKQMFASFGGNDASYSGLNTAITAAGGTGFVMYSNYCSSTESGSNVYYAIFFSNGVDWQNGSKDFDFKVRPCLAF